MFTEFNTFTVKLQMTVFEVIFFTYTYVSRSVTIPKLLMLEKGIPWYLENVKCLICRVEKAAMFLKKQRSFDISQKIIRLFLIVNLSTGIYMRKA